MKAIEYIFRDTQIHFLLSNNENVMVNATEIAKAFDRRTKDFLKSESTKKFISALERAPNGARSDQKIIDNRGHVGIYFERRLALKFAAWLDADFEVWVYSKIDEVLFSKYNEHRKKVITIEILKKEIDYLEQRIIDTQNEEGVRLIEAQRKLRSLEADKTKIMREQTNQIKLDLN